MQTVQEATTCPYSYKLNDAQSNLETKPHAHRSEAEARANASTLHVIQIIASVFSSLHF